MHQSIQLPMFMQYLRVDAAASTAGQNVPKVQKPVVSQPSVVTKQLGDLMRQLPSGARVAIYQA